MHSGIEILHILTEDLPFWKPRDWDLIGRIRFHCRSLDKRCRFEIPFRSSKIKKV